MKLLLEYKANVNGQTIDGETPLCALIICRINYDEQQKLIRCIQLLLCNDANFYGIFCVLYAFLFIRSDEGIQRVMKIRLEILRLLLNSNDVDINFQLVQPFSICIKGDTILHLAVRKYDDEIVNMILECCTNIPNLLMIHNINNETAYDIAKRDCFPNTHIIECLKITLRLQVYKFLTTPMDIY